MVQTSPRTPTCVFRSPLCVSLSSWMIGRCQKLDVSKIGFLVFLSAPLTPLQLHLSLPPLMRVPFIRLVRPEALRSLWTLLLLWHLSLSPAGSTGGPAFSVGSVYQSPGCVQLFCDPMDCSPSDASVDRLLQAGILEWVAILFSR